jgi:hypothetical protein
MWLIGTGQSRVNVCALLEGNSGRNWESEQLNQSIE